MAIEATTKFRGLYYVLYGTLVALEGKGPDDLRIDLLIQRLKAEDCKIKEIIFATPLSVEGEVAALYLCDKIKEFPVEIIRIVSGVRVGSELQFADRLTLSRVLALSLWDLKI